MMEIAEAITGYETGHTDVNDVVTLLLADGIGSGKAPRGGTPDAVYDLAEDNSPFDSAWGEVNRAWAKRQLSTDKYLALSAAVDAARPK